MPSVRATEAQIKRALSAWKGCGLDVGGMEILPDGTIKITAPVATNPESAQRATPKKWANG